MTEYSEAKYQESLADPPDPRHRRKVIRVDPPKGGYYTLHFDDGTKTVEPRLTRVLGDAVPKPALMHWAAQLEREYVISKATDVAARTTEAAFTDEDFRKDLLSALGEKRAHQMRLKEAGDIGTELHEAIQVDLKARTGKADERMPEPTEGAMLAFMAWQDWAERVALEPLHVETRLGSELIGVGGTVDCIATCSIPATVENRAPVVFDWKSSKRSKTAPNGIYLEAKVQVSVYREMAIEMELVGEEAWAAVVRLPKTIDDPCIDEKKLDVEWISPEEATRYARGFLVIRDMWEFLKSNE